MHPLDSGRNLLLPPSPRRLGRYPELASDLLERLAFPFSEKYSEILIVKTHFAKAIKVLWAHGKLVKDSVFRMPSPKRATSSLNSAYLFPQTLLAQTRLAWVNAAVALNPRLHNWLPGVSLAIAGCIKMQCEPDFRMRSLVNDHFPGDP